MLWELEFIVDHFGSMSPCLEGNDSGAIFMRMVHNCDRTTSEMRVHRLKIDRVVLDEARMQQIWHTRIQYHI
jgi:hypothetical protein